MAINTTRLIAERRKFLRTLKPKFRKVDAAIEAAERELKRILSRTRALPEEADLIALMDKSAIIAARLAETVRELEKGYVQ